MKGKNKDKSPTKKAEMLTDMSSPFDALGSYTGKYLFGEYEEPEQDVDDL